MLKEKKKLGRPKKSSATKDQSEIHLNGVHT